MANISINFVPLSVLDVDQALVFYRDGLGFTVVSDVANGDFRWVSLAGSDGQALAELVAKGAIGPLVLSTTDLDGLFESLSASGAEVLQEPMDQPWGPRDCAFRDPSGNMVRINQAA